MREYIENTLAHEFAHLMIHYFHGHNVPPHGREWNIMVRILGGDPARHHNYPIKNVRVRHHHLYTCKICKKEFIVGPKSQKLNKKRVCDVHTRMPLTYRGRILT